MIDSIRKNRSFIISTIGIALIILSFVLLCYDRYEYIKNGVFTDVALEKFNELQVSDGDNNIENDVVSGEENVEVDTDYIVDDKNNNDVSNGNDNQGGNNTDNDRPSSIPENSYIGFLEIDKINLKVGLVSKESKDNHVNKNVEILKPADYPDVVNGNFILAAHSGTSKISYFKHLYKLKLNDIASVYYKEYVYHYKIVDIYDVLKTGSLKIKRNSKKTVMTLITCTKDSKTLQTVYILELFSKTRNGDKND